METFNEIIQGHGFSYSVSYAERQFQIFYRTEKLKKSLPLISPRNGHKEAQRIKGSFALKNGFFAVVFGIASIPLLEILRAEKETSGGNIAIIEYETALVELFTHRFPDIFQDMYIFSGKNLDSLGDMLEGFSMEEMTGYRILKVPGSLGIQPDFYARAEELFKKAMASRFSDLFTRLEFEPLWILNTLSQIPVFQRAYPARLLFQRNPVKKSIGVLVSTGPSLRVVLPILKKYRDKVFLAAVDSAYRVLSRSGIQPHLLATLDAQSFTQRHIKNLPCGHPGKDPFLYADVVANPQITRCWRGPLFMGVTAQYRGDIRVLTPGSDFLERELLSGNQNLGDVQSGGSVSTTLFDLLRQMNFETIILVGSDFAYSNREIHSMGTHHTDTWLAITNRVNGIENINNAVLHKREVLPKPGVSGKNVPADYVLGLYAHWFEDAAKRVKNVQLCNASCFGLGLEGIRNLNPRELEEIFRTSEFNPTEFINRILENTSSSGYIASGLENKIQSFLDTLHGNPLPDDFSFMENIGRKHAILARRKKNPDFLSRQKAEQLRFIRRLRKRITGKIL